MNPNKVQSTSLESGIMNAKENVNSSVKRFEQALEQLANKVEDSAHTIEQVKSLARKPKDIALAVKDRAVWAAKTVAENPLPYLVAVASIAGAYWLLRTRKSHWEFPKDFADLF